MPPVNEWERLYRTTYESNLGLAAQQMEGEIFPTFMPQPRFSGKKTAIDSYGVAPAMRRKGGKGASYTHDQLPTDRRFLFGEVMVWSELVEQNELWKLDEFKFPDSEFMVAMNALIARTADANALITLDGPQRSGEEGENEVLFPAAQDIVHGSVNFTVAKFRQAVRMLNTANVKRKQEKVWCLIHPVDLDNLGSDAGILFTSSDYTMIHELVDGTRTNFLQVEVITSTQIPLRTDKRYVYIYSTKAYRWGLAPNPVTVRIDERVDLETHPIQIAIWVNLGSMRKFDNRVIRIDNNSTAA